MSAKTYNPYNNGIKYGAAGAAIRTMKEEVLKIECILGRETEKAIHVTFVDGMIGADEKDNTWFPLSQVREIHRTRSLVNGTNDSIVVTMWIARQKGLV